MTRTTFRLLSSPIPVQRCSLIIDMSLGERVNGVFFFFLWISGVFLLIMVSDIFLSAMR